MKTIPIALHPIAPGAVLNIGQDIAFQRVPAKGEIWLHSKRGLVEIETSWSNDSSVCIFIDGKKAVLTNEFMTFVSSQETSSHA